MLDTVWNVLEGAAASCVVSASRGNAVMGAGIMSLSNFVAGACACSSAYLLMQTCRGSIPLEA